MMERSVTMKGNALPLGGNPAQVGQPAPDCVMVGNDLKEVRLSDFRSKTCIISAVPSLDTPVCDLQTRRFNQEATKMKENTVVLTVSMDLPFAQKRWCGAAGAESIITLSDHRDASFGKAFGVLIEPLRLLARAVFILDANGVLRYHQLVSEVTNEPAYDEVLSELAKMK